MKLVTAIIQPAKVDDVKDALSSAGFRGMTITRVEGHGQQAGRSEFYRGSEVRVDFVSKVRVEVIVPDEEADAAIDALVAAARTGNIGDGKVWASDVSHLVRVRTGERGPDAV